MIFRYKLYRIFPGNADQLDFIEYLYVNDSKMQLQFWQSPSRIGRGIDVMVPPNSLPKLKQELLDRGIRFTVRIENVQEYSNKISLFYFNRDFKFFPTLPKQDWGGGSSGIVMIFRRYWRNGGVEVKLGVSRSWERGEGGRGSGQGGRGKSSFSQKKEPKLFKREG